MKNQVLTNILPIYYILPIFSQHRSNFMSKGNHLLSKMLPSNADDHLICILLNPAKCQDLANIHPTSCQLDVNDHCQDNDKMHPKTYHNIRDLF